MASTNKTANFQLNQWARTDGVCMDDFNSDNAKIDAAIAGRARVQSGSYVGTGTAGADHKNSITFAFAPKLVMIYRADGYGGTIRKGEEYACFASNLKVRYCSYGNSSYVSGDTEYFAQCVSWSADGKTLYWYYDISGCTGLQDRQYNTSGTTYYWIAIG